MISVVIPSRLAKNPMSRMDSLFLDQALASVQGQVMREDLVREIIIAVDPGAKVPERFLELAREFVTPRAVDGRSPGQAQAVNAGVRACSGDLVAILEDDDMWMPCRLLAGVRAIEQGHDFVSSNQQVVGEDGAYIRINDFPTPSGWLFKRSVWEQVGGMDETFHWHVDTEFLGKINKAGVKRLHLVEKDAMDSLDDQRRQWLGNVQRFSPIASHSEYAPLVTRREHPASGMAKVASDPLAKAQSADEHVVMAARYGGYPW